MKCLLIVALLFFCFSSFAQQTTLVNYAAPENAEAATDYELQVNGQKLFVYNSKTAAFAYCSFEGKLDVQVSSAADIHTYNIRPASKNINAVATLHGLQFVVDKPMQLSVEINNNIKRPLFIFFNALEKNIPDSNNKNVLYFKAGKIYDTGLVHLENNQSVYIEGGAIVRGAFDAENVHDVKILGRGILDNSRYIKAEARPIAFTHCKNVLLQGIIIMESKHWTSGSYGSSNIVYDNLKVVSDNDWDDGIDIVASQHIEIKDCFLRTKDDCIAIKSGVDYFGKADHINVDDIHVHGCTLWNGIWGNVLEIGFETSTDTIQNIRFHDCDILHAEGPEGTFTIHNGDHATVQHVSYNNIRVEDVQGYLIDFKILFSQYSTDKRRGHIQDVEFSNITVAGERFPTSLLLGFDSTHMIRNIRFSNFFIQGKKINGTYNGMIATNYADDIKFE